MFLIFTCYIYHQFLNTFINPRQETRIVTPNIEATLSYSKYYPSIPAINGPRKSPRDKLAV